jgi:hypothetical protein
MILRLLGFMDFIAGVVMVLLNFHLVSWSVAFGFALYLIFKGIMFKSDFMSMFDLLMGVYMILMLFGIRTFITYLFVAYSVYKVVISMFH